MARVPLVFVLGETEGSRPTAFLSTIFVCVVRPSQAEDHRAASCRARLSGLEVSDDSAGRRTSRCQTCAFRLLSLFAGFVSDDVL